LIEDPLTYEEGTFYCCGETVQEVNEIIVPDDADLPETDDEEILKAFRYGIEAGLLTALAGVGDD
jgi:hypothetical protein